MPVDIVTIGTHKNVKYDIGNPKVGRAVIYECEDCGMDVSHEEILETVSCNPNKTVSGLERAWAANNTKSVEKQCASCGDVFGEGDDVQVVIADNVTRQTWPIVQTCCNECDPIEMTPTQKALIDVRRFVWFSGRIRETNDFTVELNKESGWFVPFESIVPNEQKTA